MKGSGENEAYVFQSAAQAGKITDKDAVFSALKTLESHYQKTLGIRKKDAAVLIENLQTRYLSADATNQAKIGDQICLACQGVEGAVDQLNIFPQEDQVI